MSKNTLEEDAKHLLTVSINLIDRLTCRISELEAKLAILESSQMDSKSPPKRIVERLRAFGLSQAEIAKKVGTNQSTIQRIESGESLSPSYLTVDALRKLESTLLGS